MLDIGFRKFGSIGLLVVKEKLLEKYHIDLVTFANLHLKGLTQVFFIVVNEKKMRTENLTTLEQFK